MGDKMEYEKKFAEMQGYIPFLESMIKRLESTQSTNPREAQLTKIKALRNLLLDTKKRMKMENLLKCEQVLLNLYSKVGEADVITTSITPTTAMEIKKEVIEHEELAVNLQSVREKLKIVSGVTQIEPKSPSIHPPASHIVENRNTGTTSNVQIRSEINVPQLFERRPKKISPSKTELPEQQRRIATDHSPPSVKSQRKYTRILCSPENDRRRWDSSEKQISPHKTPYDSHDVQLFQRRSPRRRKSRSHSPRSKSGRKKLPKKDRQSSTRSGRPSSNCSYEDVNITLNVPEESLNSLSASDIFDRIVNCNEHDVDIKHLRELRSQIVKELKHTGANQDISDYILKSYKKKKKKKPKVEEVEEGELSDSESESLKKIYGNLIVELKNEGDVEVVGQESRNTIRPMALPTKPLVEKEHRKDSPKIKISLIISNPGDEDVADPDTVTSLTGTSSKPTTTFLLDIANTENVENTVKADSGNLELEVSGNKSLKTNDSPFFYGELQIDEGPSKEIALSSVDDASAKHNANPVSIADNKIKVMNTFSSKSSADKDICNSQEQPKSECTFDTILHPESTHSHTLKHIANSIEAVSKPKEFYMSTSSVKADKGLSDLLYKDLSPTASPSNSDDKPAQNTAAKNPTQINKLGNVKENNQSSLFSEKDKVPQDNSQDIPFLSEAAPSTEMKNTSEVISEIDILKALKNEILGEAIDIPKASFETPSLHQPKISKVTDKSQLDADNKKRISLEKYKQKVGPTQIGIFARQAEKEQAKLLSRALTPRECERFNINTLHVDDISDDESPIEQLSESSLCKLDNKDMGPKSPEEDNFSDSVGGSPVLIPSDPVHSDHHDHTSSNLAKKDVDMRVQMSSTQMTKACPVISPQPSVSAKHNTSSVTNVDAQPTQFNETQRPKGVINSSNNYNSEFPGNANYNSRNPNPFIGHHKEPLLSTPSSIPQLMGTSIMHPSMTPQHFPSITTTRGPAMTPSRCPPMTSSRVLMTPTYSPMYTDENMSVRRHVYAPSDLPDPTRTPTWDRMSSPVIRDDGSSTPVWDNSETRNTSMTRDNNFPPVWDNLGGRSPMITENSQEFGFCTPRHDPFNRIAEYNRPGDQHRANNLELNYLNRNRAARDPRLSTERKDDGFQRDPRMTNYSLGSRGDNSLDPRTNRDSRQCGPGQFFEDESSHPFQHTDRRNTREPSVSRQFLDEQRMGREYANELNLPHSLNESVRPYTRENSVGPGVQYNGESNIHRNFNRASSVGRSFGRESSVGRSVGRESSVGRNMGHEYIFSTGRSPNVAHSVDHKPCVGLYTGRDPSVANMSNMGRAQSVGRNIRREPSVGRNIGHEPSVGRNRDREHSVGRNVGREPSFGRNTGREPNISCNWDREQSVGRNVGREPTFGRNLGREQSIGRNMGRDQSVGRIMGYEPSVERNMGREASVGRNMGREASVGRSMGREASVGRNMGREASVGRNMGRETSVGRNMGRETSVGRNMGRETSVGRNMGRETSVGRNMGRETSVGRNMGREQSVGRKMGYEPSVERNMGREASIRRNVGREASVGRNMGREPSVGRSRGREPSIGRNMGRERSIGRHVSRQPTVSDSLGRERSVGRDIGREKSVGRNMSRESSVGRNIGPEPCLGRNSSCSKNIPHGKTETRESRNRPNHNRERDLYRMSDEILTGRRENVSTSAVQRGRSNRAKVQVDRANPDLRSRSASISSNSSSSRSVSINTKEKHDFSNSKDPRNPDNRIRAHRHRDERKKDKRTHDDDENKRSGIVYTSDNIAKGKLLGQGYGVKNYKIPKIKRPVEEAIKNEVAKIIEKEDAPKVEPKSTKKVIVDNDEKRKQVPCDSTEYVSGRNKKRKPTSKKKDKSDVKTPDKPNKLTPKVEIPKCVDKKTADISIESPDVQSENSSEFDEILSNINKKAEASSDTDVSIQDFEVSAKVIPKDVTKDSIHTLSTASNETPEVSAKVILKDISKDALHTLSTASNETPEDSLNMLATAYSETSEVSAKVTQTEISKDSLHMLSTASSEGPEVSEKVSPKEISEDSLHTWPTVSSETPPVTGNTISKEPLDTLLSVSAYIPPIEEPLDILSASADIPPIGLQQNKDIVDTKVDTKVDSTSSHVGAKPSEIQNKTHDDTSNDQANLMEKEIFHSKQINIDANQTLPINNSSITEAVGKVIPVCYKNINSNSEDVVPANHLMSNKLTSAEPAIAPTLQDQIFTNKQTTVVPVNLARSSESTDIDSLHLTSLSSSINKDNTSALKPNNGSTDNMEAIPKPIARKVDACLQNISLGESPKKATITVSKESAENTQTNLAKISKDTYAGDIESKKLEAPTEKSDQIGNVKDVDMLKPGLENIQKEGDTNKLASTPDSTIQIEGTEETTHDSVLPDSTNNSEINTDASSVVSSSHDVSKDEEKEAAEITKTKDKGNELDALKSLGSILSMLQDKTKMKHILTLLSDDTIETEKLKRKLTKLSEIESEDEDAAEADPSRSSPNPMVTQRLMKSQISPALEPATRLEQASTSEQATTLLEPEAALEISLSRPTEDRELANIVQQDSPRRVYTQESSATKELNVELEAVAQEENPASKKIYSPEQQQHTQQETEQISNLPVATRKYKIKKTKAQPKSRKGRYKKNKNLLIKSKASDKRITRSGSAQVPKKSRNRELQKLQEDIRDMFISQGVLSATGIRMCRLAKLTDDKADPQRSESEDHQELPPKPISKKDIKDVSGISKKDGSALKDAKPLVVLEKTPLGHIDARLKTNEIISQDQQPAPKIRKKPGPKPRSKVVEDSPTNTQTEEKKLIAKPGPKSKKKILNKTKNSNDIENLSVETNVVPLNNSFDSDDESLSSLVSGNSCDINNEPKPKHKRKYMWQHGCIKTKKKKNNKDKLAKNMSPTNCNVAQPYNCFIDKTYCFEENATKYLCRLCDYEGENIVLHFKQSHPHQEVPLSRINPKTALAAIQQSLNTDFDKFHKKAATIICRFCFQVFEGTKLHLEKFFWHVVSKHTGEYKYSCSECPDEAKCPTSLDIPTPPTEIQPLLLGYICGECHYTQISLNNLKTHVALRHDNEETEVYTINLCDVPPTAGAAKVRVSANRGKCNKTPEEMKPVRHLRPRRDVSLSESVGNVSSKSTVPGDTKAVKSPIKKQPKGIGIQLTFEGDSNDGNSLYDVLESGSETIKSEREDTDLPGYESNLESHLEESSSRRSSAASDTAIVWENAEFLETLRQAQKIKKERTEEVRNTTEESDKFIEYDKNAHFMITASKEGVKSARSYVCRVKGCGSGYRTTLLISLKKHVQFKHVPWRDVWDGYCCVCKHVVNEICSKSSQSYSDCLNHMLMNHLDEFPVLHEPIDTEVLTRETSILENQAKPLTTSSKVAADLQHSADSPAPKTYINVRPLSDLISKEPVAAQECTTGQKPEALAPRIQNVVSLKDTSETAGAAPTSDVADERGAGASGSIEPSPNECMPRDPKTKEPLTSPVDAMNVVMAEKHAAARQNMLATYKLACVFKCAGRYCSFGARAANVFVVHLNAHLKLKTRDQSDVLRCAYCPWSGGGADAVAAHVWRQHGHCRYSCAHCWYLASSPTLVELHRARAHASLPPAAPLELEPPSAGESAAVRDALVRSDAVLQYTCSKRSGAERCVFRGYTAPKFREHLELRHAADTSFACHICSAQFARASGLIGHLKQHGMCLFQCTYCLCGTDTEMEMLEHASAYHPSCRPQAYLRHIVETKDNTSPGTENKKFKVLPLVQLGAQSQQLEVCPQEAPTSNQLDCPTKEAERAHALERLFLQQQGDPTSSLIVNTDDIETQLLTQASSDSDELEVNVAATTADDARPTVAEDPVPNSPDRPLEETQTIVKDEFAKAPIISKHRKKTSDEYIICLDSDEEDEPAFLEKPAGPKPASEVQKSIKEGAPPAGDARVINLTDDEPPASSDRSLRKRSEVRFDPDRLFKCQKCNLVCKNDHYYRQHLPKCYPDQNDCPRCPFCAVITASRKEIRIHLIQAHGPIKTYRCSLCSHEDALSKKIFHHMRTEHLVENVSVCPEPSNTDKAHTLFIVKPEDNVRSGLRPAAVPAPKPPATPPKATAKPGPKPRGKPGPKSRKSDPGPKPMLRYGPEDMNRLPLNPILDEFIRCARCEFYTKVRSNMLRHLQMHANELAVPSAAPVNPVPHLESNEMHFDKMTNLAASSNAVRPAERAPTAASAGPMAPEEAAKYPRYVPDKERNACGAVGCSYISLDETLLKYHWETLHSGLTHGPQATTYRCVHCPPSQHIDAARPLTASHVVGHLKMHDARLYGCGDCGHYHYSHSMLDKHVADKHGSGARGVITIRDLTEAPAAPASASAADPRTAPTMDLKPWQCGVCKFKSMLRPEVAEHCTRAHSFKFQFKCAFCPYSGSVYTSVARHQSERHTGRTAPDVIHVYYKERSLPADEEASPLWTKQREYLSSLGDIKAEAGEPSKPASSAVSPTPTIDLALVKNEVEESPQEPPPAASEVAVARYGELGEPSGERYLCPLCKITTEESRDNFTNHLYEELNYRKWSCRMCSYRTFSKVRMMEHGLREHNQTLEPLELPHDVEIELWIERVLEHQKKLIDVAAATKKANSDAQAQQKPAPKSAIKQNDGTSSDALQELERMFGPIAAPGGDKFTCPKCKFKTEDESKMTEHLEMELAKVRWSCDRCPEKFQSYHEAQRHCSSTQHAEYARVVGVSKDPAERTQWIECVIRAQSGVPHAPVADLALAARTEESGESGGEAETDNSLLVVRYQEDVPGPADSRKLQPSRKRKPTCLREDDSDEEPRLVIADGARLHTCTYCEHTTSSLPSLRLHLLRHYNMRPYTCAYCDFTGHKKSIDRHLDKQHRDLAARWICNKVPDNAPPVVRVLSSTRKGAPKASRSEKAEHSATASASPASTAASSAATPSPAAAKPSPAAAKPSPAAAKPSPAAAKPTPASEETSYVCLLCDAELSALSATSHHDALHTVHPAQQQQIVVRGALVRKCGACTALRTDADTFKRHHDAAHPLTEPAYTMVRAGHDAREAASFVCDHCGRMFTYLRDLKCHHSAAHVSLQFLYSKKMRAPTSTPAPPVVPSTSNKRKRSSSETSPSVKRVSKKSTTKLPFALKATARKSTSKLPHSEPVIELEDSSGEDEEEEAYSYYGKRPTPLRNYGHVQTRMPFYNTMMPVSVEKLSGIVNIEPVVAVVDLGTSAKRLSAAKKSTDAR